MRLGLQGGSQTKTTKDPALEVREAETIDEHAEDHHQHHDCDDLGDVGVGAAGFEQVAQSVPLNGEDEFGAHQGSPGERETLAEAGGEGGEAGREEDVAPEAPAASA